jgi:hypothetical protein
MIRWLMTMVCMTVCAGCTPQHSVTVQENVVSLTLMAPDASKVQFADSLDQFAVHQTVKGREGAWLITGLPNTAFLYFYLVDGRVMIPDCRFKERDDFGSVNCRYLP